MLIELYGENFGCFRDRFQLSMLATDIEPGSDRGIVEVQIKSDDQPLRLLRCAAIYGPNASGKSTVLRAAETLRFLLATSARSTSEQVIGVHNPFVLDRQRALGRSTLGVKVAIDGIVYDYSCSFDLVDYAAERLVQLSTDEPVELVHRIGETVTGTWTGDSQFKLLSKAFRRNALLLSLADAFAPNLAKNIAVGIRRALAFVDISTGEQAFGRQSYLAVAQRVDREPEFKAWLESKLRGADVGVVAVEVRRFKRSWHAAESIHAEPFDSDPFDVDRVLGTRYQLELEHAASGGTMTMDYSSESHGTRRFVELAPLLYDLSHGEHGRGFFVDELDASIHPTLLKAMIHHFNNEVKQEDVRGQLVFSAHDVGLMDDEARSAPLRRDQIYFTEKDSAGAARLYSLAEFRERNNLNIRRRYLQGRYGALPSLGDFAE